MKFQIRRNTLKVRFEAERIIAEMLTVAGDKAGYVEFFGNLLAQTEGVEPSKEESKLPEVKALVNLLSQRDAASTVQLWEMYIELDPDIVTAWVQAQQQANKPLLPLWQKDGRLLTAAEKEQVQPDTPLAESA